MIEKVCIIALANFLFFLKTIGYGYSSDDIPANARPKHSNKWIHWLGVFEGRARHRPQVDHAITILIHTLVCILIYLGFGANDISFLAALLFAFNPANNQVSVWIAGRSYALAALGITLALAAPMLGPLSILLATYSNAGFLSPLALLGSPHPWLVAALPFCWLFHMKRFRNNVADKVKKEMFAEDRAIKPEKLILFTKTLGFYLVHGLIPIKTTFYHSFLQSAAGSGAKKAYDWRCRFFWIGLIGLSTICGYLVIKPWSMVHFGLLLWLVAIAPFGNFFRIQQEIAERYMYLPNVGLMYALAAVLVHSPVWSAVFIAVYATKLWFYMDCYQDDYYLTEQAYLHSPDAWFAWHVKAMKRWDAKSHQEAFIFWMMARNISPNEFKLNLNIATVLGLSHDPAHREKAKEFIDIAAKNVPRGQEEQCQHFIDAWRQGKMAILL